MQLVNIKQTILDKLRQTWGVVERTQTIRRVDDSGQIVEEKQVVVVDSPNKRLNKNVPAQVFDQFAEMVQPEDMERITAIIKSGTFEVVKAVQSFNAPIHAADLKLKPKTWAEANQAETSSLACIKKYKGSEKAASLLVVMLTSFAKKFGRKNDLDEQLIQELAIEILNTYWSFTVADIKFIFSSIVKDSKVFNLDYYSVMRLFEEHHQDKSQYAMRRSIDEHNRLTANEKTTRVKSEVVRSDANDGAIKEYLNNMGE